LFSVSHALQTQVSTDVRDQKQQMWDNQMSQILALPSVRALPSPSDSLQFHLSARNRHRARQRYSVSCASLVPVLQSWASGSSSAVLLAQGKKDPKSARHFAADVIETVRASHVPVIWALAGGVRAGSLSCSDVFRSLLVQALQISSRVSAATDRPLTASAVDAVATTAEWQKVLDQALLGLALVYIVIDTELFRGASASDRKQASDILKNLASFSEPGTPKRKVILLSRRSTHVTVDPEVLEELAPTRVFTDNESHRGLSGGTVSARARDGRSVGLSRGRKGSSRVADVVRLALISSGAATSRRSMVGDDSANE
jgi:hypothetical protein